MLTRERITGTPVIGFPYDRLVATGEVDRAEWAKIVQGLLDEFTRGKKATFGRLVGADPKTIDHWLQGKVRVSEESIRNVADKTGRNAMEWLIQVGYYTVDDMPPLPTHEEMDAERRRIIEDDTLDDQQKAYILQEFDRMEEEDERMLAQLRERDRQRRIERLTVLIEQQRGA